LNVVHFLLIYYFVCYFPRFLILRKTITSEKTKYRIIPSNIFKTLFGSTPKTLFFSKNIMTSPLLPLVKAQRSFLSGIRPSRELHGPEVKALTFTWIVTRSCVPCKFYSISYREYNCHDFLSLQKILIAVHSSREINSANYTSQKKLGPSS
jgi:hypothetical protein